MLDGLNSFSLRSVTNPETIFPLLWGVFDAKFARDYQMSVLHWLVMSYADDQSMWHQTFARTQYLNTTTLHDIGFATLPPYSHHFPQRTTETFLKPESCRTLLLQIWLRHVISFVRHEYALTIARVSSHGFQLIMVNWAGGHRWCGHWTGSNPSVNSDRLATRLHRSVFDLLVAWENRQSFVPSILDGGSGSDIHLEA